MKLSTTEALNSAIADLVNAKLCLLNATETNVREEMEQIESIAHYLESKLATEAAKEAKVGYIVDPMEEDYVSADASGYEESDVERAKELGIWLETKEEAEKAVERLRAWKRLKDKGFDFVGCFKDNTINFEFVKTPLDYDEAEEAEKDLAFLFGGVE